MRNNKGDRTASRMISGVFETFLSQSGSNVTTNLVAFGTSVRNRTLPLTQCVCQCQLQQIEIKWQIYLRGVPERFVKKQLKKLCHSTFFIMTMIRLICGGGTPTRIPKEYFDRSIFNNPAIANARSHTLQCKATAPVVGALLDWLDGLAQGVTITEDNFEELQGLCRELGFTGLDDQFRAFRGEPENDSVDSREVLLLKERVMRQEKRLTEMQHQLNELLTWKRQTESQARAPVSRPEFQTLERKVEEMARACEDQNTQTLRVMERAINTRAKQSDLEELAGGLTRLKESMTPPEPTRVAPAAPVSTRTLEFVCRDSTKLKGMIAHLSNWCRGNVHKRQIVTVTASGVYYNDSRFLPEHVVDFGTDSYFHSDNRQNSWICCDFKLRRVRPTSYSIVSATGGPGWDHLKSWVVEVRNDGDRGWLEIDRRDNETALNAKLVTQNFKVNRSLTEGFRFFRIKATGPNHVNNNFLTMCALEIFGTLFEK